MDRRQFLRAGATISAGATLNHLTSFTAEAATGCTDYKALVCLFMYGGNDANNTIVPADARYAQYAAARGRQGAGGLSLDPLSLAFLNSPGPSYYALHPQLAPLTALWDAGQMAVLFNVGTLLYPMNKADYIANRYPLPYNLMSHADQQTQWMNAVSTGPAGSGWGGRLAEQACSGGGSLPSVLSPAGNSVFIVGDSSKPLAVPASGGFGLNPPNAAAKTTLTTILGQDTSLAVVSAANGVTTSADTYSSIVSPILTSKTSFSAQAFAGLTTGIANELQQVARLIEARGTIGASRQVFFVSLGSFDTHTAEISSHKTLYGQMAPAIAAFNAAMVQLGVSQNVTLFTLSDFGRTLQPSTGAGSDHAWGSHHFIFGGAVKGGYYGTFPQLVLGGPDDFSTAGRWIPTTAVDEYAATLATWFGVPAASLPTVLPNIGTFQALRTGPAFL